MASGVPFRTFATSSCRHAPMSAVATGSRCKPSAVCGESRRSSLTISCPFVPRFASSNVVWCNLSALIPTVIGRLCRLLEAVAVAYHTTAASTILMRFRPSSTRSANLIASGSVERFSVVHSQKDAISAALSAEIFESVKPDSMMGIRPAAARRRLSSEVAEGICFDISPF